jgi:hypothetical protein
MTPRGVELKVLSEQIDAAVNAAINLNLTTTAYIMQMARLDVDKAIENEICAPRRALK